MAARPGLRDWMIMSFVYWFSAVVTAISALTSLGFSITALAAAGERSRTNARYAASRSLALAIAATVPVVTPSRTWLEAVALAMVVVQAVDAVIGVSEDDVMKTLGPAMLSLINLVALVLLLSGL
jgi:hypothetical protein